MTPSKPPQKDLEPVEELTYEQALNELESIVLNLESDGHSLEESLAMFERGQILAQYCSQLLEQAELKIQTLSGEELVDFDPS
ncbi:MAG: exodeoxyribonuclease VII small subunit [Anaerolineales bacterium]